MKKFWWILLLFSLANIGFVASSSEKECGRLQRWSKSQRKCVCAYRCSSRDNAIQDPRSCECKCIKTLDCPNYQWWNKDRCLCECYAKERNCTAPLIWSKAKCDCECPSTLTCNSRQIVLKPNCLCGCSDVGAKLECLAQGTRYSWNGTTCSCYIKPENCVAPQVWSYLNFTCECPSTLTCNNPRQSILKPNCTCGCTDISAKLECLAQGTRYDWNETTCSCYVKPEICSEPQIWSNESFSCECPSSLTCNAYQSVLKPNCSCGCVNLIAKDQCFAQGTRYDWNDTTCSCYIKPEICSEPQIWSNVNFTCECPSSLSCNNSRQSILKPNCSCECIDSGAKDQCIAQGANYGWDSTNCSCTYTPTDLVGQLTNFLPNMSAINLTDPTSFPLIGPILGGNMSAINLTDPSSFPLIGPILGDPTILTNTITDMTQPMVDAVGPIITSIGNLTDLSTIPLIGPLFGINMSMDLTNFSSIMDPTILTNTITDMTQPMITSIVDFVPSIGNLTDPSSFPLIGPLLGGNMSMDLTNLSSILDPTILTNSIVDLTPSMINATDPIITSIADLVPFIGIPLESVWLSIKSMMVPV